jgi:hypothetical protein
MDVPRGLIMPFRALWSTELCSQLSKSQLIINKLAWSKCYGINYMLFSEPGDQWLPNLHYNATPAPRFARFLLVS